MSDSSQRHPSDAQLRSHLLGSAPEEISNAIVRHLEECADCQQRIARLSSQINPISSLAETEAEIPSRRKRPERVDPSTLSPGLANHPDYEVLCELGRGGMGVVYLARHRLFDREEVLKVMSPDMVNDPQLRERFLSEPRLVAKLKHPNVVTAHSAFQVDNSIAFTMEYVDGLDLERLIEIRPRLPIAYVAQVIHQSALGLQHAHEKSMVHRDIKPGNLMVAREGNRLVAKILDFGLAKVRSEARLGAHVTRSGQMLGTPFYVSPEQIRAASSADIRADLYSLGCTLYHLLAGSPPFVGEFIEILDAHRFAVAKPLNTIRPDVPRELTNVVAKMMEKKPERRFQTPSEVAEALKPFSKTIVVADKPVSRPKPQPDPPEEAISFGPHAPTVAEPAKMPTSAGVVEEAKGRMPREFRRAVNTPVMVGTSEVTSSCTTGMKLRLIPAGRFIMGTPADANYRSSNEMPSVSVTITRAFYLCVNQAIQGEYEAVMGTNPSYFKGSDELPVENISWLDAIRYANALSEKAGVTPFYRMSGYNVSVPDWLGEGYRLPTEAEWEHACRGGKTGRYSFGDAATKLGEYAWFRDSCGGTTHAVGTRRENAFGLFDMQGNVWEWCWDWYDAKLPGGIDPRGPINGLNRVIRGGSWYDAAEDCRAANRDRYSPLNETYELGFRLARNPSKK